MCGAKRNVRFVPIADIASNTVTLLTSDAAAAASGSSADLFRLIDGFFKIVFDRLVAITHALPRIVRLLCPRLKLVHLDLLAVCWQL